MKLTEGKTKTNSKHWNSLISKFRPINPPSSRKSPEKQDLNLVNVIIEKLETQ